MWELSRENSLQADELAELNSKLERLKLDKAHTDKELQEVNSDLSHVKVKAFEMEQRLCTKTEEVDSLFGKNERLGAKLRFVGCVYVCWCGWGVRVSGWVGVAVLMSSFVYIRMYVCTLS